MSSKSGGAKASRKEEGIKVVSDNRRARYDYEILQAFEAGIELKGSEVKSLRTGHTNLAEAYATMKGGELWLINSNIPEYREANRFNHEPKRPRKLLLHKSEINKLSSGVLKEHLTIIPLKMFFNLRGRVKVDIALARGKKLHDKRETIKERSWDRERARLMRDVELEATSGAPVNPARIIGPAVIFCYPFTGRPGYPNPPNWDHIKGAHGSTPQALAYSEAYGEFRRLGVKLFGLSLLDSAWQKDFVARNALSYRLLSDYDRAFQSRLGLPMFETAGELYLQRITFILHDGIISSVRFPVPVPEEDAAEVLAALA